MEILYHDEAIAVAIKPRGALSERGAGGDSMPELLADLGGTFYPVHRLDRAVGGVMVYARSRAAAASLSESLAAGKFRKHYVAVVSGEPLLPASGEWRDYLFRDTAANKSYVVGSARSGAREAVLRYRRLDTAESDFGTLTRVEVELLTGRSHQIRVQFSSRGRPLVGDGKYGSRIKAPGLALFASSIAFPHPTAGRIMTFSAPTPAEFPWNLFADAHFEIEHKYLIRYPDVEALMRCPGCRVKKIVQTYLKAPPGETVRVRRVECGGVVKYIATRKRRINALRCVEEERVLTAAGYARALESADEHCRPIVKTRYCIPYAGRTVEVDLFSFWQDRALAEVEVPNEHDPVSLPPALRVIREVTLDPRYKNVHLAREVPNETI